MEPIVGRIGRSQMIANGHFSEEIEASGPWEARFRFCGEYGVSPDRVTVFQSTFGKYWCSVGRFPDPFLLVESLA